MNAPLKAIVALDQSVDRELVEALVSDGPELTVLDFIELDAGGAADDGTGDVLLVACGSYGPGVGEYVADSVRLHPLRPVVLLCTADVNGYVSEAFHAGADDIIALPAHNDPAIVKPLSRQVLFTLEKTLARKRGGYAEANQNLGNMICILGLKGGSGKTLTAANLAAALADAGKRVAIVDLDLQFGDVGLALGLSPDRTIYDLVRSGGSLDGEKLDDFLMEHQSGVRALLAPARPDQAGAVTVDFLREVYRVLRERYDFVVVDTPPSFTPEVIAAVDNSTEACLVAMLDSLSLKNTKLGLETLELMDYDPRRIRLVLNRADSNVGISPDDVHAIMGREPDVLVPSDRNVVRSINQGEPIALGQRRSEVARAFHSLAGRYIETGAPSSNHASKTRRRLFRRSG